MQMEIQQVEGQKVNDLICKVERTATRVDMPKNDVKSVHLAAMLLSVVVWAGNT